MKITFKENKKMQQLKDVGMGQTFIYNHKLYIKMGEYSKLDYNALLLSHGFLEKLPNNCDVEVVNCELIVSRCERSRYESISM